MTKQIQTPKHECLETRATVVPNCFGFRPSDFELTAQRSGRCLSGGGRVFAFVVLGRGNRLGGSPGNRVGDRDGFVLLRRIGNVAERGLRLDLLDYLALDDLVTER